MTAAGHMALEDELNQRIRIERPRLVQRIQEAIADDSNLAENSEYQAAKTEQEINEARIAELEDNLARSEVIDVSKLSGDTITFGATVTLIDEDTGERKVWQIVGEPEADVKKGKISVTSPIARALIGKANGATVEVEAPGGAKAYKSAKCNGLRTAARGVRFGAEKPANTQHSGRPHIAAFIPHIAHAAKAASPSSLAGRLAVLLGRSRPPLRPRRPGTDGASSAPKGPRDSYETHWCVF